MNITAAARAAGISPSGLRWYESIGVLPPAPRGENGYRQYSARDISQLRLVLTLRRLGLNVIEAGRLARLSFEGDATADSELRAVLERQRAAIAERRADLDWLDRELGDLDATWRATQNHVASRHPVAPINVLFLCNANSGRSQIGEALLKNIGCEQFRVQSAGGEPAPLSELAVTVLAEVGIDWRKARPKALDEVRGPFDYVITLSDSMRESCDVIEGPHNTLHWHFPDPSDGPPESRLDAYRRIRDEVSRRLVPFVELALRTAAPQEHPSSTEEVSNG